MASVGHDGDPRSDSYDVVVVGSGLAGLSAAALLSKAGKSVLVCEQAEAAGGYAHGIERPPYKFDTAVHVFPQGNPGGLPDTLFDFLGVGELVELIPVPAFYKAVYPDLTIATPRGYEEFSATLSEVWPAEAGAIRAFVETCEKVHWQGHNQPPRIEMADLATAAKENPELFKYVRATAQEVLDEFFEDAALKSVLGVIWPYLAVPPSRVSAVTYLTMVSLFLQGAHYSRGTFEQFVKAFAEAIEKHGGELVLGNAVTGIAVDDGAVRGVELEGGQRVSAANVISNADALTTFDELVGEEHLPRRFMNKMRRMRPSLSGVVVFVGTSLDLGELGAAHEVFRPLHTDHDRTYDDILAGKPGGMWGSVPSLIDDSLAPEGEHAMTLTSLAPYDIGKPWESEIESFTDQMLEAFEVPFPGLRDSITFLESGSPETLERHCRNQRGAIYGWENIPSQSGGRRAPHETEVGGLYMAGHWTQPGTGSIRVIVSGMHAAELVLRNAGADGSGFEHPDYPPI
jgi:phytoene desaturase